MIDDSLAAIVAVGTILIAAWFAPRVHKLESRVDELEAAQTDDRAYIAKLRDFIYKLGKTPPDRDKE